jgi:ceramide glucosyltransferase
VPPDLLALLIIAPSLLYTCIALACTRAYFGRPARPTGHVPPLTILKPVKGLDADAYENFASFCRQDYPDYQIVFAVASAADPVLPVIRRLMADFPERQIDLVVDSRLHGPNHKVGNLINAYPRARHDLLVVCDSDIRVGERFLREVAAPFADPQVGLVSSLYHSPRVRGVAGALEAMGLTVELIPNVLVARRLEGLSFALGAAMTVRRAALEAIGGFPALADYLADDYQLGNQVCRAGWRLELSSYFVESRVPREGLVAILSRQLRWSRAMRASRPLGYFGSGITQPFPLALLALVLTGGAAAGWRAVALLYLVRGLVALVLSRHYLADRLFPRWLWLLPLRDVVAFTTWALAFLGNRIQWRGVCYRLVAEGKMVELP